MRKREIRDLLSRRTDLILFDRNLGEGSDMSYDSQDDQLDSLLELAASLKETLVPLTNPSLKTRVREIVASYSTPEVLLQRASRVPAFWILVALVGSIVSLISVIILLLRKAKMAGKAHIRPPFSQKTGANQID